MKLHKFIPVIALAVLLVGCGKSKDAHQTIKKDPEIAKVDALLADKGQKFSVDDHDSATVTEKNKVEVKTTDAGGSTSFVSFKYIEPLKIKGKNFGIYEVVASGSAGASGVADGKSYVVLADIQVDEKPCLALFGSYKNLGQAKKYKEDVKKALDGDSSEIGAKYFIV